MKQSLPSFVDLLSSLGLNDKDQPPPSSQLQAQQHRPSHEIHLRTDSWGSTHSSTSSQRTSPVHPPQVRLSGRQSSFSSTTSQSHRFSPYGQPRDLNDRRGSLPSLSLFPPPPAGGTSNGASTYSRANTPSSIAAQRRRSGSLPTLLESPFAFMSSLKEAQHFSQESIEEDSISSMATSAITSPGSSNTSPYAYTFPPPPDRYWNSNGRSNDSNSASRSAPSISETPNASSITTTCSLPPLAPLSPQKRHLAPRTRLSIAISSPPPPAPSSSSPLRSPVFNTSNKNPATTSTPLPPSPFRSHHTHHNSNSFLPSANATNNSAGSSSSPSSGGRHLSPTASHPSPPISSFIRRSSNTSLPVNGPATSPIRTHHPHPYAKPTSPIEANGSNGPDHPPDGSVGGGVVGGQRFKRRGSLTLSLAPLSLSVSRHNRQSHSAHHRRTTSNSSTHSLRSPTDSSVNGGSTASSSATTSSTTTLTPRTPLSPMAIPTLPEAVGLVQRSMIISGVVTPTSSFSSPVQTPQHGAAGMQVPTLPTFLPPALPALPILGPLTSGPRPDRHLRTGKMRSMGHMRMGSWDRERERERHHGRERDRDRERERKRIRHAASSSGFSPASGANSAGSWKHPQHTNSLPPSSWTTRAPPGFPKRNITAPAIIIKQEEVDSEVDELEMDELAPEINVVDNRPQSDRLPQLQQQHDHDEHDAGYASASTASATSGGSAGSHSEGSSVRDGYDAQDEMQLDDPDEYEGGVGISITSQRRASLHPFDGHHPNVMHHHTRSHSDQGPNGSTRLTGILANGAGRLGLSSFSSLSSSSTGKLRTPIDNGRIAPPPHNFANARLFLPSSPSSSSSMKIARRSRSTASDSPSPAHSSPSSASTTGTRTPTGLSSGGGSAGATATRRSPPSLIVSSAA